MAETQRGENIESLAELEGDIRREDRRRSRRARASVAQAQRATSTAGNATGGHVSSQRRSQKTSAKGGSNLVIADKAASLATQASAPTGGQHGGNGVGHCHSQGQAQPSSHKENPIIGEYCMSSSIVAIVYLPYELRRPHDGPGACGTSQGHNAA
ncbi:hypothetical protein K474DRAFT_1670409 [Panus rudis PR-1116 ss-1]|nr:hypothetical protein K474DRAFT_1670409 [Panus rudis PR-1116 ss-1]